ncbi:MAG: pantetheine-phosphate adenylyltransferase [Coriobacteriaceae bacterium]|nr:pantetheine-phosphate adenylyltransferase [Coriobacteriaceae bacterium]MDD6636175.1 pantetheine-phosphate adenylyltransferase [Coriobacteriaceae bacterium]MDO4499497.1 pantetheine-phosphate adenylyltransferase [Coriobacteriaceae bacterium]MDY4987242.1 pantetheine-phosphate adenylyltransferase [Eggerthellaceae bacterium]MDY5371555.1 pantetheine-phosphate adenylyltransferase [Eggerthellaceae bacterium]
MSRAVVPGTFDPITRGHIDIITRAAQLFDEVIVGVAESAGKGPKGPLFSHDERVALARESLADLGNVSVMPFSDLLVRFARSVGADTVVKGLRAITDFEYEFQMAALNYQIDQEIETVFIMSAPGNMYLSSSVVREIARFGGDTSPFVTPCVDRALKGKFDA